MDQDHRDGWDKLTTSLRANARLHPVSQPIWPAACRPESPNCPGASPARWPLQRHVESPRSAAQLEGDVKIEVLWWTSTKGRIRRPLPGRPGGDKCAGAIPRTTKRAPVRTCDRQSRLLCLEQWRWNDVFSSGWSPSAAFTCSGLWPSRPPRYRAAPPTTDRLASCAPARLGSLPSAPDLAVRRWPPLISTIPQRDE